MIYSEAAKTFAETLMLLSIGGPMLLWKRPQINIGGRKFLAHQLALDILRRIVFGMWLGNICFLAIFYNLNQTIFDAIRANDLDSVKRLLFEDRELVRSRTFDFNGDDPTPLHLAASSGNIALLKILLSAGADVNANNDSNITPLVNAVEHGNQEAAELLILAGADVNVICGREKSTLVMISGFRNDIGMTKMLLEHGARWDIEDRNGINALQYAKKENHPAIVQLMTRN